MRKPSVKPSAGRQCASCHRNQPTSWRCKPSIAFAGVWSPTGSGSSIRFAVFCPRMGLSLPVTSRSCGAGLAVIVGNINDGLSEMVRALMRELQAELAEVDARITAYDRRIKEIFHASEQCQRLGKIEGIGPVTATALIAAVGDRSCFKNGRQLAAWLGLVPKQRSSVR